MKELCPRFVHCHGIWLEKQREIVKKTAELSVLWLTFNLASVECEIEVLPCLPTCLVDRHITLKYFTFSHWHFAQHKSTFFKFVLKLQLIWHWILLHVDDHFWMYYPTFVRSKLCCVPTYLTNCFADHCRCSDVRELSFDVNLTCLGGRMVADGVDM